MQGITMRLGSWACGLWIMGLMLMGPTALAHSAEAGAAASDRPQEQAKEAHPHRPDHRPLSPAELAAAMDLIREIRPSLAERLEAIRQDDPDKARELIQSEFPRLRHLLAMRRFDPAMFELRVEDVKLAYHTRTLAADLRALRQQPDVEAARVEAMRTQLRELISEHFAVRQKIRQLELAHLEQRLETLREQLQTRADAKAALIEQRLTDLTASADEPTW